MFTEKDDLLGEDNLAKLRQGVPAPGREWPSSYRPGVEDQPGRIRGQFIKGPIPMSWIEAAARSGGPSAVLIGVILWFQAGLRGSRESIPLSNTLVARFGLSRSTKYNAVESLERAGLITVVRKPWKSPVVTIVEM